MDPFTAAALITGGAGLIGGIMNRDAVREANYQNIKWQEEFAKNGLKWKMEEAEKLGIHPLVALGAQGPSFSANIQADPMGSDLANMGQNIGRMVSATKTDQERKLTGIQLASAELDLQGKAIDNAIRSQQLKKSLEPGNPPFPGGDGNFIPGQGNSGPLMDINKVKRGVTQPGADYTEAGWTPDLWFARTKTGLVPVIPQTLSEPMEDDIIGKAMWRWRNNVTPNFGSRDSKPADSMLPKGAKDWDWNYDKQEWQPVTQRRYFGQGTWWDKFGRGTWWRPSSK